MNCKQGDLAIVINDDFQENIGKLVSVGRPATEEEFGYLGGHPNWVCKPIGRVLKGWSGMDDGSVIEDGNETAIADSNLRPIRPLDELDDVTRDEEVTA